MNDRDTRVAEGGGRQERPMTNRASGGPRRQDGSKLEPTPSSNDPHLTPGVERPINSHDGRDSGGRWSSSHSARDGTRDDRRELRTASHDPATLACEDCLQSANDTTRSDERDEGLTFTTFSQGEAATNTPPVRASDNFILRWVKLSICDAFLCLCELAGGKTDTRAQAAWGQPTGKSGSHSKCAARRGQ
jgi:hypothetical protein